MEDSTTTHLSETAASTGTPQTPPPTIIHVQPEKDNRTPLWILIGTAVGFLLPICACGVLLMTSIAGLGLIGGSTTATDTGTGDAVAIIRVEGTILSGEAAPGLAASALSGVVMDDLKKAVEDESVKAIVLRIDSPGGSVTGSAQIHEVLAEIDKPIVVSMAGTAASGGYYISAPADYIYARPDTVTGSIGVVMTLYNAEALITTYGVDVINLASGPNKTIGSMWHELTPEHRQILQTLVDESYDDFVQIIVDGRGMDEATVLELADGRIYTGRQATTNGLVDALGNFEDAITKAAELGGIDGEPRRVEYIRTPTLQDIFLGIHTRINKTEVEQVQEIINTFGTPLIEYRYVGPMSP